MSDQELLAAVRAGFITRQTTMTAWCRENGIAVQNVRMALLGGWRGPKARKLVARIKKAAGLATSGDQESASISASILEPVKELTTDIKKMNRRLRRTLRSQAGGQSRPKGRRS